MAARFGATIIPFAAIGAEDGVNIVRDSAELMATPLLGDFLRSGMPGGGGTGSTVPQARRGVKAVAVEDEERLKESFIQPIVTFNAPARSVRGGGVRLEYAGRRFTDVFRCSLFLPGGTLSRHFPPPAPISALLCPPPFPPTQVLLCLPPPDRDGAINGPRGVRGAVRPCAERGGGRPRVPAGEAEERPI